MTGSRPTDDERDIVVLRIAAVWKEHFDQQSSSLAGVLRPCESVPRPSRWGDALRAAAALEIARWVTNVADAPMRRLYESSPQSQAAVQ